MSKRVYGDAEFGRVQYRKWEGSTPLYVIYERSLTLAGNVTEELSIQGMCEVCWVDVPQPDAAELGVARWLLAEGRGRIGWRLWLHEVTNEFGGRGSIRDHLSRDEASTF